MKNLHPKDFRLCPIATWYTTALHISTKEKITGALDVLKGKALPVYCKEGLMFAEKDRSKRGK